MPWLKQYLSGDNVPSGVNSTVLEKHANELN